MEYHYTYELRCNETNQLYIGKRSCKVEPELDKYWSSSRTVKSMISQGYTFDKKILNQFASAKEALQDEINLHALFDVARNATYLNKVKQTSTGWDFSGCKQSDFQRQRARECHSGRKRSNETRFKMAEAAKGREPWNKGVAMTTPVSAETRKRMSEAQKGKTSSRKGCTLSLETRNKLSDARKGRQLSCVRCHRLIDGLGNLSQHYGGNRCIIQTTRGAV